MLRFVTLSLAFAAAPAAAHQDEIVVTGRGLAQGLGEDVYDTVVIGRERLIGSASNRLEEILREVPGSSFSGAPTRGPPIRPTRERRLERLAATPRAAPSLSSMGSPRQILSGAG